MLKSIKILSILVGMMFIINSCQQQSNSKLFSEKITKTNLMDIVKQIRDDKTINKDDLDYFSNGITRIASAKKDSLIGKTVGEVIALQKELIREQSAATLANQSARVELVMNHEFKFIGMAPRDTAGESYDLIVYELKNVSDKEITNLQGAIQFYDQSGQIVKNYPLITKNIMQGKGLKPGESRRFIYPFNHDAKNERDQKMRNEFKDLRPVWIATMIEFVDGTNISVQKAI
jgi:hypothetical protein